MYLHNHYITLTTASLGLARLQLDSLVACSTAEDVRHGLSLLPDSLDRAYAGSVLKIDAPLFPDSVNILTLLSVSEQPVSLQALVDVIAISHIPAGSFTSFEEHRPLHIATILQTCNPLIQRLYSTRPLADGTVNKTSTVRLAHATVAEFLRSEGFFSCIRERGISRDMQQVHATIAQSCLRYLLSCTKPLTKELLLDRPFAQQAASRWMHHYRQSQGVDHHRTLELALRLMDRNGNSTAYRNWLKLYSLEQPHQGVDFARDRSDFRNPLWCASSAGLDDLVRALLGLGHDPSNGNPLNKAVQNRHTSTARLLLEAGANITVSV